MKKVDDAQTQIKIIEVAKFMMEHMRKNRATPFFPLENTAWIKDSKQFLDIKLRPIKIEDLTTPLKPGTESRDIEVALQGGRNSLNLNFTESRVLLALQRAYELQIERPKLNPIKTPIKVTRAELFRLMQWDDITGAYKARVHKALMGLKDKSFVFVFKQFEKWDKKGEPRFRILMAYEPLLTLIPDFRGVTQLELPEFQKVGGGAKVQRRIYQYMIHLNPCVFGDFSYFRMVPSSMFTEISAFRAGRGEKAEAYEANFIEYLYTESRSTIEINAVKLGEKIQVGGAGRPGRLRARLRRCYETARALGFLLEAKEDQPAARGGTKEILSINPARFKYLKERRLIAGAIPPNKGGA